MDLEVLGETDAEAAWWKFSDTSPVVGGVMRGASASAMMLL